MSPVVPPAFPVALTERAATQIARLLAKDGREDAFLRVGIKGGGCSGFEYVMRLDTRRTPYDVEAVLSGVKVVCDAKSAVYLQGATLDYTGNLVGSKFQFDNTNAARHCGCDTSFTPTGTKVE